MTISGLPQYWRLERIGDLCLPVEIANFEKRETAAFRYVDISSVDNEQKIIKDISEMANAEAPSRARQVIATNDVLVSTVRPGLNAVALVPAELNGEICSTGFCVLRANTEALEPAYLFAWTRHSSFIQSLIRLERGIGYPAVSDNDVKSLRIPLPPLLEQRRVIAILRQADELRRLRREADEKARQFLSSLFLEIFGDPATNPKGWEIIRIEKLLSSDRPGVRTGPFGSSLKRHEYTKEGIPVWGINNIQEDGFTEEGSLFISQAKFRELEEYSVESGDILISRAGTVGKICIARPPQHPSIIGTNLIRVAVDSSKVTPEYFVALFSIFADRVGKLRASGDDSSYSFLNPKSLKALTIPLPLLSLQKNFAFKLMDVQEMKNHQAKANDFLDQLFQSLLAQAFTGELTAAWREEHKDEVAIAAAERDKALGQAPALTLNIPLADLKPEVISVSTERPHFYRSLNLAQKKILETAVILPRHFTAEKLSEDSDLPNDEEIEIVQVRHGLEAMAAAGLLMPVSLPAISSEQGPFYFTAYRPLQAEDEGKGDASLLKGEMT